MNAIARWLRPSFAKLNLLALAAAAALSFLAPGAVPAAAAIGRLYLGLLKALAPFIVFFAVADALASGAQRTGRSLVRLLAAYLAGMVLAGASAIGLSLLLPAPLPVAMLASAGGAERTVWAQLSAGNPAAAGSGDALSASGDAASGAGLAGSPPLFSSAASLLFRASDAAERFAGALPSSGSSLLWVLLAAAVVGTLLASLRLRSAEARQAAAVVGAAAVRISGAVRSFLKLLPLGLFGLFAGTLSGWSPEKLAGVGRLALLLSASSVAAGCLALPLLFRLISGSSPWRPLWWVLRESALPALLTRSSLANLPVNLAAAKRLGLPQALAQAALPIGAVFNMPGAVVTLAGMTMSAAATLGVPLDAGLLVLILAASAASSLAASGLPNGAVFVLPLMLGLLGAEPAEEAAFVAAYFMASILQDAFGTALNSSSDLYLLWAESIRLERCRLDLSNGPNMDP